MNSILTKVIDSRCGHYCHCIEVSEVYELEAVSESIYNEFLESDGLEAVIEFLESLQVYCLDEENETEVFNFSFGDYIENNF